MDWDVLSLGVTVGAMLMDDPVSVFLCHFWNRPPLLVRVSVVNEYMGFLLCGAGG